MTNQIAVQVHCDRLEEVLCEQTTHIYQYETGGYAYNGGVPVQLIHAEDHKLTGTLIKNHIRPDYDWLPATKMVVIENSANKAGGIIYLKKELQDVSETARSYGLKIHLDGARIYNAMAAGGYTSREIGPLFDTISICLSKGLGCPVGSVLIGSSKDIKLARRLRKAMGGGMRQSGMLAAAGLYALNHHVKDLETDHEHAQIIAKTLENDQKIEKIYPVETNIVIAQLKPEYSEMDILKQYEENNIGIVPMGPGLIRFVTHRDLSKADIEEVCKVIERFTD